MQQHRRQPLCTRPPLTARPGTAPPPLPRAAGVDRAALLYCERFLELTIDLLSQLPTRRFVATLLEDRALLVKCRLCALAQHPAGHLFRQLSDLLQFYINFPINSHTGAAARRRGSASAAALGLPRHAAGCGAPGLQHWRAAFC